MMDMANLHDRELILSTFQKDNLVKYKVISWIEMIN